MAQMPTFDRGLQDLMLTCIMLIIMWGQDGPGKAV